MLQDMVLGDVLSNVKCERGGYKYYLRFFIIRNGTGINQLTESFKIPTKALMLSKPFCSSPSVDSNLMYS